MILCVLFFGLIYIKFLIYRHASGNSVAFLRLQPLRSSAWLFCDSDAQKTFQTAILSVRGFSLLDLILICRVSPNGGCPARKRVRHAPASGFVVSKTAAGVKGVRRPFDPLRSHPCPTRKISSSNPIG